MVPGSTPDGWTRVASLSEVRARGRLRVEHGGRDILVVSVGGEIYACGNICAHQHVPALHSGTLSGRTISCPMHGWTYDLESGASTIGEGRIPVYAVAVRDDDILLRDIR